MPCAYKIKGESNPGDSIMYFGLPQSTIREAVFYEIGGQGKGRKKKVTKEAF